MSVELRVDRQRWQEHLNKTVASTPGIVPVIKGNGYGFGRSALFAEATRLEVPLIAVGTYDEAIEALDRFAGDIMVLNPWRPFLTDVPTDDRIIHTVGRIDDVAQLAAGQTGARVVVEGETSMARHGLNRHEISGAVAVLGDLDVQGFALHLPMAGDNVDEATQWAAALELSQLRTSTLFVSHLLPDETEQLRRRRENLTIRSRIGTALWLGELAALTVTATVIDSHQVERGEKIGYRQRPMPRDGRVLIIEGGTSHGIGLEAPRAASGVVQRGKFLAKGSLAAAGLTRSPFEIGGKQRWFAEPPHMQSSMVFVPESVEPPEVGDQVSVAVRFTTTTFDRIVFD